MKGFRKERMMWYLLVYADGIPFPFDSCVVKNAIIMPGNQPNRLFFDSALKVALQANKPIIIMVLGMYTIFVLKRAALP